MSKTTFKGSIMLNPVPSVLITSRNSEGKDNVFTVGWIGTACTKPPMITVAIRPERLSYDYIKEGNSFVVNLASTNLVKAVDYCGVRSGRTTDKFKDMNLTLSEAKEINCGIIDQCPVAFECVVKSITPLGTHDLFLAEIVSCHVDDNLIDNGSKIHFEKADLLTYSHGEYFSVNPTPIGKFGYSVAKKSSSTNKSTINSTSTKSDSLETSSSKTNKSSSKTRISSVKATKYSKDDSTNKSSRKNSSYSKIKTEFSTDKIQKHISNDSTPNPKNKESSKDESLNKSKVHTKNNKSNKSKTTKTKKRTRI
ncbi:MAG: flavin reductase family protein [Clostridium sp.]|uniref:flavin reductase family protein n=1 Tax=Clostridium sp. TaxID=1506 RepID=UPI003216F78A